MAMEGANYTEAYRGEGIGTQQRVSPAFASEHGAYQRAEALKQQAYQGQCESSAVPQRIREMDALGELLRAQIRKVREANIRLGEMRGRVFGEGASTCTGGLAAGQDPVQATLYEARKLFEQLDAETEELLGHIGRLEDLA